MRADLQRLKRDSESGRHHEKIPTRPDEGRDGPPAVGPTFPTTGKCGPHDAGPLVSVLLRRSYWLRRWLAAGCTIARSNASSLTDKDTIVIADFDNKTGDAVFDDTLKTALTVALNQSPFLSVLPENKVAEALKLMTKPADTKLTSEIAQDLCERTAAKPTSRVQSQAWAPNT